MRLTAGNVWFPLVNRGPGFQCTAAYNEYERNKGPLLVTLFWDFLIIPWCFSSRKPRWTPAVCKSWNDVCSKTKKAKSQVERYLQSSRVRILHSCDLSFFLFLPTHERRNLWNVVVRLMTLCMTFTGVTVKSSDWWEGLARGFGARAVARQAAGSRQSWTMYDHSVWLIFKLNRYHQKDVSPTNRTWSLRRQMYPMWPRLREQFLISCRPWGVRCNRRISFVLHCPQLILSLHFRLQANCIRAVPRISESLLYISWIGNRKKLVMHKRRWQVRKVWASFTRDSCQSNDRHDASSWCFLVSKKDSYSTFYLVYVQQQHRKAKTTEQIWQNVWELMQKAES